MTDRTDLENRLKEAQSMYEENGAILSADEFLTDVCRCIGMTPEGDYPAADEALEFLGELQQGSFEPRSTYATLPEEVKAWEEGFNNNPKFKYVTMANDLTELCQHAAHARITEGQNAMGLKKACEFVSINFTRLETFLAK